MKINLPHYTSMDYRIMLWVITPFSIILNSVIFGSLYFTDWRILLLGTAITFVAFSADFILCGFIAVALKERFPLEKQIGKRLTLMIVTFWTITILFLFSLFQGYEFVHFFGYTFNENGFVWSCIALGIMNVFLTFLHEGVARYESWKKSTTETEQLDKAYTQSRLMGLKSQVNPHFLFNSLNSLSSLISEDEVEAEKFLNEMSKVYRYMLRNDDETLVTLDTELKFIASYMYLLKARYGEGLQLVLDVIESAKAKMLPPLTLQVIIENTFTQNSISKSAPLKIFINYSG